MLNLKLKKVRDGAIVPSYAKPGDACFDLHACFDESRSAFERGKRLTARVRPNYPVTIGTGWAVEVPEGHVLQVFSRSGHGVKHKVRLSNGTGIIDSGYRGELMVSLTLDHYLYAVSVADFVVNHGDRIAQAMIMPRPFVKMEVVDELSNTERGTGGLGSTGTDASIKTPENINVVLLDFPYGLQTTDKVSCQKKYEDEYHKVRADMGYDVWVTHWELGQTPPQRRWLLEQRGKTPVGPIGEIFAGKLVTWPDKPDHPGWKDSRS